MLVIRRSEPHHVPVVSRQRSEVSNLSLRSHASILVTDSPHNAHQPSRIQNATGCVSWKIALLAKNSNLLSVRTRFHRIPSKRVNFHHTNLVPCDVYVEADRSVIPDELKYKAADSAGLFGAVVVALCRREWVECISCRMNRRIRKSR